MTDRGTSVALGYVLTLAIAAVLATGLLVAGGNFVEQNREQVVNQELSVVGQHIASNIETADRLVEAGNDTSTVTVNQTLPERVTGASYRAEIVEESGGMLRLNSTRPDVSVEIDIDNRTALGESHADGGAVSVVYNSTADELVIRDA